MEIHMEMYFNKSNKTITNQNAQNAEQLHSGYPSTMYGLSLYIEFKMSKSIIKDVYHFIVVYKRLARRKAFRDNYHRFFIRSFPFKTLYLRKTFLDQTNITAMANVEKC